MADSRVRIGSEGPLSPEDVARKSFSTTRRGFDPTDVRSFLEAVAAELRRLRERIRELERQPDELRAAAPPAEAAAPPALDIATLTTALGEETARVLRTAQEAAADLRARAEEGAARALNEAHAEAARVRGVAETLLAQRTEEADAMAAKLRAEVESEVNALRARAEAEAEAAIQAAVERGREMVGEAQAARERMLTDLARRRKTALSQLERLRAGRERLLSAYRTVRQTLEEVTSELDRADTEARAASEIAARRTPSGTWGEEAAAAEPPELAGLAELPPLLAPEPTATRPTPALSSSPSSPGPTPPAPSSSSPGPAQPPPRPIQAPAVPSPASTPGDQIPAATLPTSAVGAPAVPARPSPAVTPAAKPAGEVDELFARIRADRAEATVKARETLAGPEAPAPPEGVVESVPAAPAEHGPAAADKPKPESGAAPEAGRADDGGDVKRSDADEAFLGQRDELIEPLSASLTRQLKRLLQDEQNVVLDRLRKLKGKLSAAAVLPAQEEHPALYVEAAMAGFGEAARAGVTLAASIGAVDNVSPIDADALRVLADGLASELLDPLRQRLERSINEGDDASVAGDAVSSAYRELKSRRIERAVGDRLTGALTLGIQRSLATGTPVRWLVDDADGPCPDCDDNALAGPTPLGEAFPTGQVGPPAHPGCRCLLGPVPT